MGIGVRGVRPEGSEAAQLAAEIKNNPEWLQKACETAERDFGPSHPRTARARQKLAEIAEMTRGPLESSDHSL